jgi:hypothetical protein
MPEWIQNVLHMIVWMIAGGFAAGVAIALLIVTIGAALHSVGAN